MVYQSDYCYSPDFARCSVFLAWAARNAAEPAYVTEAAQKAWGSGITAPEGEPAAAVEPALAGRHVIEFADFVANPKLPGTWNVIAQRISTPDDCDAG